jgi:hypothetical protein
MSKYRNLACVLISLTLILSESQSRALAADPNPISARLDCSALTANPDKAKAFTSPMVITTLNGTLRGERKLMSGDGIEKFEGRIDPLGRIEMTGGYSDRRAWTYRLRGQLSDTKPTVLKGRLEVTTGTPGHRDCTLTFTESPADLMAAFSAY